MYYHEDEENVGPYVFMNDTNHNIILDTGGKKSLKEKGC